MPVCYMASIITEKEAQQVTRDPSSNPTNDFSSGDYDCAKVPPSNESPLPSAIRELDREALRYANGTSFDKVLMGGGGRAAVAVASRASFFSISFFLVVILAAVGESPREGEGLRLHSMHRSLRTTITSIRMPSPMGTSRYEG